MGGGTNGGDNYRRGKLASPLLSDVSLSNHSCNNTCLGFAELVFFIPLGNDCQVITEKENIHTLAVAGPWSYGEWDRLYDIMDRQLYPMGELSSFRIPLTARQKDRIIH